MSVLLDSDVTIEIQRGRDEVTLARWTSLVNSGEPIFISPVVLAECWAGARPKEYALLDKFFSFLPVLPIDAEVGRHAGDLLRKYAASHSLDVADALIAATAIKNQLALWTRNKKHYPMNNLKFF